MMRWVVGSILHGGPRSDVALVRAFAHGVDGLTDQFFMVDPGVRCSSVVRAFAHGAMGRWI